MYCCDMSGHLFGVCGHACVEGGDVWWSRWSCVLAKVVTSCGRGRHKQHTRMKKDLWYGCLKLHQKKGNGLLSFLLVKRKVMNARTCIVLFVSCAITSPATGFEPATVGLKVQRSTN